MVDAPFDEYLDTPNKSIRQNVPRKGVVLHHAAMTSLSGLQSLAMGGKQVSATAIAKDRISKRLMTDEFRAWSLSSAWGDSSFRSVETCNQSTDGWTISDESHWELAYLVAYWALLDGFWPHRDGDPKTWTVIGHREAYTIWAISYGTACPGGMDLNLVTARAQQLIVGVVIPEAASKEDNMLIYLPTSDSSDGVIRGDTSYISEGGPIRPLSRAEHGAYVWFDDEDKPEGAGMDEVPARWVKWSGQAVRDATRYVGVMEHSGIAVGDVPKLTGRIIYDDPANSTFPRVAASVTLDPAVLKAQIDAAVADAIAKLQVPTAEQNGAAARAAIVK